MRTPAPDRPSENDSGYNRWWFMPGRRRKAFGIAGLLVEIVLIVAVTVFSLYFQLIDRPTQAKIYYTDDPYDTVRGGVQYACGCDLPATVQSPQDPFQAKNTSLNVCYDKSSLETVTVFMFQNSTPIRKKLDPLLQASGGVSYTNVEEGRVLAQEAHDLTAWTGRLTPLWDIRDLFLGRKIRELKAPINLTLLTLINDEMWINSILLLKHRVEVPPGSDEIQTVDHLLGPDFLSFPTTYLRLAFSYNSTNCSSCGIERVRGMASSVAEEKTWASCFYEAGYRVDGNKCSLDNYYTAKCVLYPTDLLPFHFAIKDFLQNISTCLETGAQSIRSIKQDVTNISNWNGASMQPSALYMNFSQVQKSSITLGFVEVVKGSAYWVSLSNLFPDMSSSCSGLTALNVSASTSMCNVFNNAKTNNYDLKCFHLDGRTDCPNLTRWYNVDNARELIVASGGDPDDITRPDWEHLMCPNVSNELVPPYLVNRRPWLNLPSGTENNESNMDAFNVFLYDTILEDDWAQRSGACLNTFDSVLRQPPGVPSSASGKEGNDSNAEKSPETRFLKAKCNEAGPATYCWLTGDYVSLNHIPGDAWKRLNANEFPLPKHRFVCYRVVEKGMVAWCIVIVGIVFGWIGTVQLIFGCLWWAWEKAPSWSEACRRRWQGGWWGSMNSPKVEDKPDSVEQEPGIYAQNPQLNSPVSDRMRAAVKRSISMAKTSERT